MELTLDQALQKGIEAHKAGKIQEADRYYTAILKAQPKHPDANHNMGVLAVGAGKVAEALPFFKKALEANSSAAQFWLSYIDALIKLSRIDDANAVFDLAKSKGAKGDRFDQFESRLANVAKGEDGQTDEEILEQAVNLRENGKYDEAINLLLHQTKQSPKGPNIPALLSHCYILTDNLEQARIYLDVAKNINPKTASVGWNETRLLVKQKKVNEALAIAESTNKLFPDDVEGMVALGSCLRANGRFDESLKFLNKAIELNPNYAEALINRGLIYLDKEDKANALTDLEKVYHLKPHIKQIWHLVLNLKMEAKDFENTIALAEEMVKLNPVDEKIFASIAVCYQHLNNYSQAVDYYKKAISIKPDYLEACVNLGSAFKDQGDLEEAIKAYKKALTIKPDFAEAHRNLSVIKKYIDEDDQIVQVQELYKQEDLSEDAKCHLNFALAKIYEDIGELDQAFSHLSEGNALRKKLLQYSINQDKELFTKLIKTQPYLQKSSLEVQQSSIEPAPIFILGMPRSGTTLVEQIVSSHSEVTGAGELRYVSQLGRNLSVDPTAINTAAISEFRERYISEISKLSNEKQSITDKMPQNFRYIPLICAAFPEAKIIHVQRNAIATCWSNYKKYFVSNSLGYCYDLRDVVEYYNLYKDLMKFWQSNYSARIYNLNYENLVDDQENQTRKLIKRLELNWEEACLSPQENKRSVRTASQQQVRQKVYQGSSEAWRKYEPYLNGLFDNLPS